MQADPNEANISESHTLHPQYWVSKHADYLYAYALVRINDQDQARDIVQEVFLAALESAEKFEGRSSERTWLTAILKFKVIDFYRKNSKKYKPADINNLDEEHEDFFDTQDGHWNDHHRPRELGIEHPDALENKEFQKILQQCMEKLPGLWLAVFTMKHMDDEATETICRELKVTASNFWVIIHRTKVNLRSCLQKNWI
ncbi:RNA polymerase sigma-70 factor (ECF subfamily) [Pedobacter sp. AK017]|uniref:sigma-70 family RNA polymerase sigma factor n=1 Tax=Pedobacter sp. AK017 TaxID=2723073 RepID=UPI00161EDCEB|nr:sigma-70 family RNA polymerase sigma factor [Pedobacter sp. AK017]MBB5438105.1 RNA polymerase sigma-70 factor (ECF subfamily) [Pedobacter sp. AK017]